MRTEPSGLAQPDTAVRAVGKTGLQNGGGAVSWVSVVWKSTLSRDEGSQTDTFVLLHWLLVLAFY